MTDEARTAVADRPHAAHLRVRAGLRRPHNWLQLIKFCTVGASGYVVNLCVFAAFVELLVSVVGVRELPAQAISIIAATPLNFIGNKMWSFRIELSRD